ncbi:MAG: prepilin peptidase [Solirubrobacterales bacterium]
METIGAGEALTCLLLGWACASDLRTRMIPNACSVGGAIVVGTASLVSGAEPLALALAVVAVAVFLGGAALVRPDGLGAGDAKLAVLLAAAMGSRVAPALLLGLLGALAGCLGAWAVRGRGRLGETTVPLAPFLAGGAALTLGLAG